jgi:hypothetical protein
MFGILCFLLSVTTFCHGNQNFESFVSLLANQSVSNFLNLLDNDLLSEKCLNHSNMIQQKLANPIQALTDAYWDLKSEFFLFKLYDFMQVKY